MLMQHPLLCTRQHPASIQVQTAGDKQIIATAPKQASSSAAESYAATKHIGARAETIMSIDAIVTELSTLCTDVARDVVTAAQVILEGNQKNLRKLCKP